MGRVRRAATGVAAVGALAVLAACGGGDDAGFADGSAASIVTSSKDDMGKVESVHFEGELDNQGQSISLDLDVNTDGDCQGTFGLAGGTADIVSLDGQTWFKPDAAFWRASAPDTAEQTIAAVGDNWVALGADDDTFDSFCDLDELLDQLFDVGDGDGDFAKDGSEEVDSEDTVRLTRDDSDGGTVSAFVATASPHHLLRLSREGENSGAVTFSKFDERLDISEPAADEVVDISSLS